MICVLFHFCKETQVVKNTRMLKGHHIGHSQEPVQVTCPVNGPKMDGTTIEMTLPLLQPFEVVKFLYEDCKVDISMDRQREFWQHLDNMNDPWAVQTQQFRAELNRPVLTCGFYGDEANLGFIGVQEKIYGFFMNLPLWRPRSTRHSRVLLFSIRSELIIDPETTLYPVLRCIVQSFNKLSDLGLSDGTRCLVSEIRGDQAFFRYMLQHKAYWVGNHVCFRCKASTGGVNDYTDLKKHSRVYSGPIASPTLQHGYLI